MDMIKYNKQQKVFALILVLALFVVYFPFTTGAYAANRGQWAPNTAYTIGDTVTYNSVTYTCIQSHTSLVTWEPPNVPALWQVSTTSTVATPVFSPGGGTYSTAQSVTITCTTSGATIRYTTDGSAPTSTSAQYTGVITVASTSTIKAKGFKSGMNDSAVASATYTISSQQTVAAPVFNPAGGTYSSAQSVTMTCATNGATIRYTTDGSSPTSASALYSGAITVSSTTTIKAKAFKSGLNDSAVTSATYVIGASSNKLLIGYWHTWNSGTPFIRLRDVNANWDVINIAFAEPVSPGSTDGNMKFVVTGLTSSYTINDFKADIQTLKNNGKKVVLSIGGYEGYFSLTSSAAVTEFVRDIKGFIDEYGFNGIDIDLEQYSVEFNSGADPDFRNPTSPKVVNMISAIRSICNSYSSDFILSWAPETFYLQLGYQYYGGLNAGCDSRAGVYIPMINALRDKTTYVHTQLYNSIQVMAPDGNYYSMGNSDAIVAMCNMLLNGFNVGGRSEYFFQALRPDQVVIGVPASANAAGSGQISNQGLQQAFNTLSASFPGLRGIMTWSINWDAYQNNNSFAQSNGAYLDSK
jgi:chitinase